MDVTLKQHFLRHALPLTVVRTFASDNYPKAGGYAAETRSISVRKLSDSYLKFYGR
jgi:hypothetical protein